MKAEWLSQGSRDPTKAKQRCTAEWVQTSTSKQVGGQVQVWAMPNKRERGPNKGAQPRGRKQEQAEGGGGKQRRTGEGRTRRVGERWRSSGRSGSSSSSSSSSYHNSSTPPFFHLVSMSSCCCSSSSSKQINILLWWLSTLDNIKIPRVFSIVNISRTVVCNL